PARLSCLCSITAPHGIDLLPMGLEEVLHDAGRLNNIRRMPLLGDHFDPRVPGKLVCGALRALDEQVAAGRPLEHHDISSAFELANKEVCQHSTHVGAVLADLHRTVIALDEDVVVNAG